MRWLWLCVVPWVVMACAKAEPDSPSWAVNRQGLLIEPEVGQPPGPLTRAPMTQRSPRLVATAAGAMAAWVDQRDLGAREQAIYAARIFPDGGVGDPAGFRVATADWMHAVAVASDGTRVLVVWSAEVGSNSELFGVIFDAATGAAQGPARSYTTSALDDAAPAATFDGTDFIVAWIRDTSPNRALVQRIDPATGNSRDPAGVPFGAPTLSVSQVSVASIRGGHSALFIDQQTTDGGGSSAAVYFMLGGVPALNATIAGPSSYGGSIGPATASSYFVAWRDLSNGFPELLASRLDVGAGLLDSPPLDVARGNDGGLERDLGDVVLANGSAVVSWSEFTGGGSSVKFKRFDAVSGVSSSGGDVSATNLEFDAPTIAPLGASVVVAWGQRTNPGDGSNDDIFFTTTPAPGTGRLLSASAPTQARAAGTTTGRDALLAWTAYNRDDTEIELSSWNPDATAWSATSVVLSPSFNQNAPALATDRAGRALATFERNSGQNIEAVRLTGAALIDTAPLTVCSAAQDQFSPVAAFDGTRYWTVWLDDRGARAAFANRVTPAGQVLDGQGLALPLDDPRSIAATSGPDEVLFASHDGMGRLQLARTLPDAGFDPNVPTLTGLFFARPALAFDGLNYLAAWEDDLPDGGEVLLASRFDVAALTQLDDPPRRIREVRDVDTIGAAFDGMHFLITWVEQAATPYTVTAFARRYDSDGQSVDVAPVPLSNSGRLWGTRVSGVGQGRSYLTFSRFDEGALVQTYRARVVTMQQTAGGDACTSTADCPGSLLQCVDGVCCNAACGGGNPNDCIACSRAAGGQQDGVCTLRSPQPCRAAASECDLAESCTGRDVACPADQTRSGQMCSVGVCVGTSCEVDDGGLVFPPDAGVDGGADAGLDAGAEPDDAGTASDGGVGRRDVAVGCACSAISPPGALLFALAFRAILNRRRATARDRSEIFPGT